MHASVIVRLLALSLLAACGAPPPAPVTPSFSEVRAFNPLEVCETSNFGRYARGAVCRDTHILFVSREVDPSTLLEARRVALTAYGVPVEPRSLVIGNRERPALGYYMGSFEASAVGVLTLPLEFYGSKEAIEAHCYHYNGPVDPKRCSALLDAFVAQGVTRGEWPTVLAPRDPQKSHLFPLFGREVPLPAGCDELGPFEMECRDGRVKMLVAEERAQLARAVAAEESVQSELPLLQTWTLPCTVEGVATECSASRHRIPFDELFVYRAALEVQGRPILLTCEVRKSAAQNLPGSICSQFFQAEVDAWAVPELPEGE